MPEYNHGTIVLPLTSVKRRLESPRAGISRKMNVSSFAIERAVFLCLPAILRRGRSLFYGRKAGVSAKVCFACSRRGAHNQDLIRQGASQFFDVSSSQGMKDVKPITQDEPVLTHGMLNRRNMLVAGGSLTAISALTSTPASPSEAGAGDRFA